MDAKQLLKKDQQIQENPTFKMDEVINEGPITVYDLSTWAPVVAARDIEQTKEEALEIKSMIDDLKLGKFKLPEEEAQIKRIKLEAIQGRNMAHLMVNDHVKSGDSPEMELVKSSLINLEQSLAVEHEKPLTSEDIDQIDHLYVAAMDACNDYCKKKDPWTTAGKIRKENVKTTLKRLMREYSAIELGRRALADEAEGHEAVNSGMQLLTFGTITDITERLRKAKLPNEIEETKAKIKLLKQQHEEDLKYIEEGKKELEEKLDEKYPVGFLDFWSPNKEKRKQDPDYIAFEKQKETRKKERNYDKFEEELETLEVRLWKLQKESSKETVFKPNEARKKKEALKKEARGSKHKDDAGNEWEVIDVGMSAKMTRHTDEKGNEWQVVDEKSHEIAQLPKDLQDVAFILYNGDAPSMLLQNTKKLTLKEKTMLTNLYRARNALTQMSAGKTQSLSVRMGDHFVRFIQDRFGQFEMKCDGISINLNYSPQELTAVISQDVIRHPEIYGDHAAYRVMSEQKTDLKEMTYSDLAQTRDYAAELLTKRMGIQRSLLNNVPVDVLKNMAVAVLEDKADVARLREQLESTIRINNEAQIQGSVNTVMNQEMQKVGLKTEGVVLDITKEVDKSGWTSDEQSIRDFLADILFTQDSLSADELQYKPGERMKKVLYDNRGAIAKIISDQFRDNADNTEGIVESMFDALPIFAVAEKEDIEKLKSELKNQLAKLKDEVQKQVLEHAKDEGLSEEEAKELLKSNIKLSAALYEVLPKLDAEKLSGLAQVEQTLDESVHEAMNSVQGFFNMFVDKLLSGGKEDDNEEGKKQNKEEEELKYETDFSYAAIEKRYQDSVREKEKMQADIEMWQMEQKELEVRINELEKLRNEELEEVKKMENGKENKELRRELVEKYKPLFDMESKNSAIKKNIKRTGERLEKKEAAIRAAKEAMDLAPAIRDYEAAGETLGNYENKVREYDQKISEADTKISELKKSIADDVKIVDNMADGAGKEGIKADIAKRRKELNSLNQNRMIMVEEQAGHKQLLDEFVPVYKEFKKKGEQASKQVRIKSLRELMRRRKEQLESDPEYANYKRVEKEYSDLLVKYAGKDLNTLTEKEKVDVNIAKMTLPEVRKSLEKYKEKEREVLEKSMKDAAKGKKGQGLFFKNVLKTYFSGMSVQDQRSMLAGAIRNSRAIRGVKPGDKLTDDARVDMLSDIIGGMFKGAGPLFQKMLQGLPTGSFSKGLQKAVEDTMDNLASIPDQVIKNHMNSIIARSKGKIEKIEVKKSLGAASVGQAFLCMVYGPGVEENGRQVVIKVLRPDARNRMMREKEVMLNAAKMTDRDGMKDFEIREMEEKKQIGGMEATYTGNLERIEEELDLTIEVQNCEKGKVYDAPIIDEEAEKQGEARKENLSHSMKMSTLADATSDTCIMEMAGSKTVKRYMSDARELMNEKLRPYIQFEKQKDKDGIEKEVPVMNKDGSYMLRKDLTPVEFRDLGKVYQELGTMLEDVEKRQQGMLQLSQKWVTEGIFEKGFYHGDLHAGNIMISDKDKGVTAIDFGNATVLTSEQQKHVNIMMMSAATGEVEKFRESFHALLVKTPESVYKEKEEELTLMLEEVMSLGNQEDAGRRIAVILIRAQELGLEMPPVIANFSTGQMRLMNAVNSMNNLYKDLRANVILLANNMKEPSTYQRAIDPILNAMTASKDMDTKQKRFHFKERLRVFEGTKMEDFKKNLLDKDSRMEFSKLYNLPLMDDTIQKEVSRVNELLKNPTLNEAEKRYIEDGMFEFEKAFPALASYKLEVKKRAALLGAKLGDGKTNPELDELINRINLMESTFSSIGNYLSNPKKGLVYDAKPDVKVQSKTLDEFMEYVRSQDTKLHGERKHNILDGWPVDELQRKLNEFYKAQDEGKAPEELERMADEVWKMYEKDKLTNEKTKVENTTKDSRDSFKRMLPTVELMNKENGKEKLTLYMSLYKLAIESCEDNPDQPEEVQKLKSEKEVFLDLYKQSIENEEALKANEKKLEESYNKLMDLLDKARIAKLRYMSEHAEAEDKSSVVHVNTGEVEDFISVMGTVIEKYKWKAAFRIGLGTAKRMVDKLQNG